MKKYIFLLFLLVSVLSCDKPEDGLSPQPSVNANIVRFRIYQNQNVYFDGVIQEERISITIPGDFDKTKIHPEILLSFGATVNPASGVVQDFTKPVQYVVTSENKQVTKTYQVTVYN